MADEQQAEQQDSNEDKRENTFCIRNCEIVGVVVYQDRAEVTRKVTTDLKQGPCEVVVKDLSEHVDSDSIRVEGKGTATITEVTYQEKQVTSKDVTNKKRKELEEKRKVLKLSIEGLENKKKRLDRQKQILDGLADTVKSGGPKTTKDDAGSQDFLSEQFLGNVSNFLEFYLKSATDFDENLSTTQHELEELNEELKVINASLQNLGSAGRTVSRETSILLDVHEAGDVTLLVSYVVSRASWYPKYDIRAFSDDKTIKILYHGMIEQSTGEDWNDAKISLSTATPSIGGTVPELGTMTMEFPRVLDRHVYRKSFRGFGGAKMKHSPPANDEPAMLMSCGFADFGEMPPPPPPPVMEIAQAEVVSSTTTAHFEVSRKSTIPSDNTSHKVTIAMFDLKSTFEYQSVPKKAAHAFFKAKVTNTSAYAMLAGDANIFLDNNFIAKSYLKAVSPSEEFECSLGVDNGVRVTYKPLHKFRENSGIISKTTTTTYHQVIELKNTHTTPIKITVTDHFPKSNEAKIKVNLIEPVLVKGKGEEIGAHLNKDNNVEWVLNIEGSSTKELSLKYTVEHPSDKRLEIYE